MTSSSASRTTDAASIPRSCGALDTLGRHQGLGNMRDRAIGMGGTFAVERPDGAGTRIIVRVPVSPSVDAGERPTASTGEN